MSCIDGDLIASEFRFAADLLRHACRRGRFLLDRTSLDPQLMAKELERLTAEHQRVWLARNRPGGLADSAARLTNAQLAYQ